MSIDNRNRLTDNPDHSEFMLHIVPHLPAITTLIRFRIRNKAEWDDILQNTLLCAWQSFHTLQNFQSLKPWLLSICGNCCRMHLRSSIRHDHCKSSLSDEMKQNHQNSMGRSIGDNTLNTVIDIQRSLEKLSDRERRMLINFYFKDLKVAEIALLEQRPAGTIKRWMHTSRNHLKNIVDEAPDIKPKG